MTGGDMYRHLGGRLLLVASGASGLADVTGGSHQPPAVDAVLTLLAVPLLVEVTVALGLLAVVIGIRSRRRAVAARPSWSVPFASCIRPADKDTA
jgi:hypothetical protein